MFQYGIETSSVVLWYGRQDIIVPCQSGSVRACGDGIGVGRSPLLFRSDLFSSGTEACISATIIGHIIIIGAMRDRYYH